MKSNRQKRAHLQVRKADRRVRLAREAIRDAEAQRVREAQAEIGRGVALAVDPAKLAPSGSYDEPDFVRRGTYRPRPFVCAGCGAAQVWTPRQQKWWYEVAGGDRFSGPKFCRPCRAQERARKAEARRTHLEGAARKAKARFRGTPVRRSPPA